MNSTASPHPLPPQGNNTFAVSVAMLLVRMALGWTFIYHGAGKALGAFGGMGIDATIQYIGGSMPKFLPAAVWGYMLAYGELIGGLTVLFGFLARLGTIPIIISMLVAIAKVHGPIGFSNPTPGGLPGYEFNTALLSLCAAVLIIGPGIISVDAFLFRPLWSRGAQPLTVPAARA